MRHVLEHEKLPELRRMAIEELDDLLQIDRDVFVMALQDADEANCLRATEIISKLVADLDTKIYLHPELYKKHEKARDQLLPDILNLVIHQTSQKTREAAMTLFYNRCDKSYIDTLITLLEDDNEYIRYKASRALEKMPNPQSLNALMHITTTDPSARVRGAALIALEKITELLPDSYHLERNFLQILSPRHMEVTNNAFHPKDILSISENPVFYAHESIMQMSPENRFSIARSIIETLTRFDTPMNDSTISTVLEHILVRWKEFSESQLLDSSSRVLTSYHVDFLIDRCAGFEEETDVGTQVESWLRDTIGIDVDNPSCFRQINGISADEKALLRAKHMLLEQLASTNFSFYY